MSGDQKSDAKNFWFRNSYNETRGNIKLIIILEKKLNKQQGWYQKTPRVGVRARSDDKRTASFGEGGEHHC